MAQGLPRESPEGSVCLRLPGICRAAASRRSLLFVDAWREPWGEVLPPKRLPKESLSLLAKLAGVPISPCSHPNYNMSKQCQRAVQPPSARRKGPWEALQHELISRSWTNPIHTSL